MTSEKIFNLYQILSFDDVDGVFSGHSNLLMTLSEDQGTILGFFISGTRPFLFTYNPVTGVFTKPYELGFTSLKASSFDFYIHKLVPVQQRLLLVKNTTKGDCCPLLMTNESRTELFPINLKLGVDCMFSSVGLFNHHLYLVNTLSVKTLSLHPQLLIIDLTSLKVTSGEVCTGFDSQVVLDSCLLINGQSLTCFGGFRKLSKRRGVQTNQVSILGIDTPMTVLESFAIPRDTDIIYITIEKYSIIHIVERNGKLVEVENAFQENCLKWSIDHETPLTRRVRSLEDYSVHR